MPCPHTVTSKALPAAAQMKGKQLQPENQGLQILAHKTTWKQKGWAYRFFPPLSLSLLPILSSTRTRRCPSAMQIIIFLQKPWTTPLFLPLLLLMVYIALFISHWLKSALLCARQPAADGRKAIICSSASLSCSCDLPGGSQLTCAHLSSQSRVRAACHRHHKHPGGSYPLMCCFLWHSKQASAFPSLGSSHWMHLQQKKLCEKGRAEVRARSLGEGLQLATGCAQAGRNGSQSAGVLWAGALDPNPSQGSGEKLGEVWESRLCRKLYSQQYTVYTIPPLEKTHNHQRKVCFSFSSSSSHQTLW